MTTTDFRTVVSSVVGLPANLLQVLASIADQLTPEQRQSVADALLENQKEKISIYNKFIAELQPLVLGAERTARKQDEKKSREQDRTSLPSFD